MSRSKVSPDGKMLFYTSISALISLHFYSMTQFITSSPIFQINFVAAVSFLFTIAFSLYGAVFLIKNYPSKYLSHVVVYFLFVVVAFLFVFVLIYPFLSS